MRPLLKSVGLAVLLVGSTAIALSPALTGRSPVLAQLTTTQAQKAEGDRLFEQGTQYFQASKFEAAIQSWQQALTLYRSIKAFQQEGATLGNLGNAYEALGQYAKAIEYQKQWLVIARKIKDRRSEGIALDNLGNICTSLGTYTSPDTFAECWEYYNQALKIFRAIKDIRSEGNTLGHLSLANQTTAIMYANQGKAISSGQLEDQVIEYDKQWLKLARATGDRQSEGRALGSLGIAYSSFGRYPEAIEYFQQSLAILREIKDRRSEGWVLGYLGIAYGTMENYTKAIEYFQQCLEISRAIKDRKSESFALSYIGRTFYYLEQPELAILFYKQSVNVSEAIRQDLRQLPIEYQSAYIKTITITYRRLADLLLAKGRILEAQQVLELLKVQELKDFDRTTRAKIDNGKIELDPTEQTIVDKYDSFITFGQKIRVCQENKPRCADYDDLIKLRIKAEDEYDRAVKTFETAIRVRKQDDENSFLNPKNRFSGKVQEILETQPNTALIYSLVTDDKLWLVVASKGETLRQFEVKLSQTELNGAVVKFRQLIEQCERRTCTASDTAALNTISQQLYDWLFPQPLQAELKKGNIKHLIFAPDRITRYLPMGALFDGKQYLIENYTVSTIVSAEFTNTDKPNYNPQTATVLAAGLSNAAPPNFPPLSNVPTELAAIVQSPSQRSGIYPGLELLNQQFDFLNLQKNLSGYTILHIATHGAFVRDQADASYILLGTGQKLPISDIKKLSDLGKIHLVVLSACQTALAARGADGIEISNVSFSFMERGVKAVIASLWQVNDASTSLLMQQFYKNLATGNMTKAEALRQAQLSLLNKQLTVKDALTKRGEPGGVEVVATGTRSLPPPPDFSHPYYWAAFILIGNGL
jgi:CHAT domain-containing protein/Flp pilus assembly protein TadD